MMTHKRILFMLLFSALLIGAPTARALAEEAKAEAGKDAKQKGQAGKPGKAAKGDDKAKAPKAEEKPKTEEKKGGW